MATGSPRDQEDCKDLSGAGEADLKDQVLYSVTNEEDNPKSSLDFSLISSGSSSFEVLSTSAVASTEIPEQGFDKHQSQLAEESGSEKEDLEKLKDEKDEDEPSSKSMPETTAARSVIDLEDEESSRMKSVSLDGSLVVLGVDDIHNSAPKKGRIDHPEHQTGNKETEIEDGISESKQIKCEDGQQDDEMAAKKASLGESMVVLCADDMHNSVSEVKENDYSKQSTCSKEETEIEDMISEDKKTKGEDGQQGDEMETTDASLGESLVVLGSDDLHDLVSEEEENDHSERSTNNKEGIEIKHGVVENKTTSEIKFEDGRPDDKMETKDRQGDDMETKEPSLGESLVVLGPEDFEDSLSSGVNPQPLTDRMIAGLINSTDDLSHAKDAHRINCEKSSDSTHIKHQEPSILMEDETKDLLEKDDSSDEKDKKMDVSIVDIPLTESTDKAGPDSQQHDDDINRPKDSLKKQRSVGEFERGDDLLDFTDKCEEDGDINVTPLFKKYNAVAQVADSTLPDKLDKEVSECGSQDNSLIVLETPDAVEAEDSPSSVSISYSQVDRENIDSNVQQIPVQMEKTRKEGKGKDTSLSESLVVIERDEVGNALHEEASETDGDVLEDDLSDRSCTPTEEFDLNPTKEGRKLGLGLGKTCNQPPVELTHKVIESIVESMPSRQMNEQAYHLDGVEENKHAMELCGDGVNYQRNSSLLGSTYSTDSFCVLSDSMSESFQNSEMKVNQLQSNFVFTGGDLPVINNCVGIEEVTGGDDAIGLHDTNDNGNMTENDARNMAENDARNMAENDAGNMTENHAGNITENHAGTMTENDKRSIIANDSLNVHREYVTEKTNETEGYQMDHQRLADNSETIDGKQLGAMSKLSAMSEIEEKKDSSEADKNFTGRKVNETRESDYPNDVIETEGSIDHKFPSLFSEDGISMSSFEVINGKGGSKYLACSLEGASEEIVEHSTSESRADSDELGGYPVSTLDEGGHMIQREQINLSKSGLGKEDNESHAMKDSIQRRGSFSLLEHGDFEVRVEDDRREERGTIASVECMQTTVHGDEPNTYTSREDGLQLPEQNDPSYTETLQQEHILDNMNKDGEQILDVSHHQSGNGKELQLLQQNDPDDSEINVAANLERENFVDGMENADEGIVDTCHHQAGDKREKVTSIIQDLPADHHETEIYNEEKAKLGESVSRDNGLGRLTDVTNFTLDEPVETDAIATDYRHVPLSLNHKNAEEDKIEVTKDLASLKDVDLLKDGQHLGSDTGARKNFTYERNALYEQNGTISEPGRDELGPDTDMWNDLNTLQDPDQSNYELNGPNIIFQNASSSKEITESGNEVMFQREASCYVNRIACDDEVGKLSITSNEENQHVQTSPYELTKQPYGQEEEEDDTTMTIDSTVNASVARQDDKMSTRAGNVSEDTTTTLEWYNESVTIYVLRDWLVNEDQKPKQRKDQQPITKDWITIEKVKFMFDNFRLSMLLKAKLPRDTSVEYDDVKRHMHISNQGQPFRSDEDYRKWWIETMQAVFQTVDTISAYLVSLDNISRDATIECIREPEYANLRVLSTQIPETFLVFGTANVGSMLYSIQSIDDHHQLVRRKCMTGVKVERMPEQWTRWCRHLAEDEDRLEMPGILEIFTNEDDGHCYVIRDKRNKLDKEKVLEISSQRSASTLEKEEYQLLSRVEVKKYIDDNKLNDVANHWMVKEDRNSHKLIVLADSKEIAENVQSLIKSSLKKIDLKTQGTEYHNKLEVIARQFGTKMCWFADEATRMIHICITDDILDQVRRSVEELLGGRKSASIKRETITKKVLLDHYDQIKFLNKYVKYSILQLRHVLQVAVSFQDVAPDRAFIKITGEGESVQAAHAEIQTMVNDIKSFQHPNVEICVPDILINKVRDLEHVNRCVIATHITDTELDDDQLTFDNFPNRKTVNPTKWWACGQGRIGLVMGPVNSVDAKTIVNLVPMRLQSAESSLKPTIFVPHHDEGKAKHDLSASIKLTFERLSRNGKRSIAVDLHHCCDWPFQKFLKVILQAIRELLSHAGPDLGVMDIVLAVLTEEVFHSACDTIFPVFQEPLDLPVRMVPDRPQVFVIKGDITKEQTDAIVNTAQKNLDLSHGAVSQALANRAGKSLQAECRKTYPQGLKHGELAITGGYQLNCKHIFHGAFETWPRKKRDQMKPQEILGKFVTKCLEKAEELRISSISFPAIGTGNLGYPASVVAQEMLQRIRCFMKDAQPTSLKTVRIVIYPSDTSTHQKFVHENADTADGSSVDPKPKSQLSTTRKQDRHPGKVHFRVTCSAADQMILVRKIDDILSDILPRLASSQRKSTSAAEEQGPESSQERRIGGGYLKSSDELHEDLEATPKDRSSGSDTIRLNATTDVGSCVIVRGTHNKVTRKAVLDWLEDDVGVTPFGVSWPYKNDVYEVLVTCARSSDVEKVLRRQCVDFKTAALEKQVLFNIRASIDSQFSHDKHEIQDNSGATVDIDSSGICYLAGNLPQIEAANEFIVSKLRGHLRKDTSSNELCVDGITKDVYKAFSFFFHWDPSYNRYKDCLNGMKYSETDRTIRFDGSREFGAEFQKKLAKMKIDITCDQIDVTGRHFKGEEVQKILSSILNSQYDVHVSIPQDDMTSFPEMKVINLIGLDRNKVQAIKYQVLESIGMTSSRRNRRFGIPSFLTSRRPDPTPILPPPPSAKEYQLGDKMTVLAYEGNILYLKVDGIVNAANQYLDHGGGVAGAISGAADIQKESTDYVKSNGNVPVGTSCHTSAGNLKHYKYIIHTVGPRWDGKYQSTCEQQLQDAITSCILKAEELGLESVAIPAVSAGIFSMPPALCVEQYGLGVKRAWSVLQQQPRHVLKEIHFVDKNVSILLEIQNAFDNLLEGSKFDPSGHAGNQVPYVPYTDIQGARPKQYHLHPFKEVNNRDGIYKTIFELTHQVKVHVYTCDILAVRVDAVVCGQDKSLMSRSRIAARVGEGELSGQDFGNKISEIKKQKKHIKPGELFCIPIKGFDAGLLLMVICPSVMPGVKLAKCKDEVRRCVQNILNKANEMKLRSIALPVLGSGNDVSKTGEIAKVIVEQILHFYKNSPPAGSLSDIHFVNHDANVTKVIVKLFDDYVKTESASIRNPIQPKVYPGMAHREGYQPTYSAGDSYLPEHERYSRDKYKSEQRAYPENRYPPEQEGYPVEPDQYQTTGDFVGQFKTEQEEDLKGRNKSELGKSEVKPMAYDDCVICIDAVTSDNVKTLPKCNHSFHPECIDAQFKYKPVCPTCGTIYGVVTGNQPQSGTMKSWLRPGSLPGFEKCQNHFHISYYFPDGIQASDHPYPGKRYKGTSRTAYLPNTPEGQKVHEMLRVAFDRRLTFTIGHSRTTGEENVVTWNDIHHKTNRTGGQQQFGYPDPDYLARVTDELAVKGVTEADIK